jgi:predicted SPOUT superfamily RNA methylase MTH1
LAVFCVDEIVVFDDGQTPSSIKSAKAHRADEETSYTAVSDPCHFLAHVLSYLETPPYLRKALFPMHPNLRTAGTLPSLDMPHHSRTIEHCDYREGVTVEEVTEGHAATVGTLVDVGLPTKRLVRDVQIPLNTRVTVKLARQNDGAEAVAPTAPREEAGFYWGYTVRRCNSLSAVFTECPFDGGYDLSFGTSERGEDISQASKSHVPPPSPFHILVVFGGVAGLEAAAKADPELQARGIGLGNVGDLFDHWVNILPDQGSRTIRTEEAVWVGLMALRNVVKTDWT